MALALSLFWVVFVLCSHHLRPMNSIATTIDPSKQVRIKYPNDFFISIFPAQE